MSFRTCTQRAVLAAACVGMFVGVGVQILAAGPAGAVTATKVELKNGQLRLEGHAQPIRFVIVQSVTSVAGARSDLNGLFKVQADGFTAPDCYLTISDNATPTATVAIPGCTPSITPVPTQPAAPTGSCVISPVPATTLSIGVGSGVSFQTTGCDTTTNSGATPSPVRWSVVAGAIPTGMTGPNLQATNGNITGIPSVRGTYRFTLQVADQIDATDQENVTVTVI